MTRAVHRVTSTVLGLFLGLLSLVLLAAAPASAADDSAVIDHAQPTKGAVRLLVSVPGTDPVDYDKVAVTINGNGVESSSVAASSTNVQRTSILAIDTSNSMKGPRITEAKKAALAYLASVPDNVKVGVVSFDDTVRTLVAPTLDRAAATKALGGLTLTLHTALYDGVLGALKAAGPQAADAGQRKILVLSDGDDTTSTNLTDVLDAIKQSGVGVDVVSLRQGTDANQPLNAMAAAGKGKVFTTADPATLTTAFASEANALARQIVVTAQVPAGFQSTSSNVDVTVPTGTDSYTASAYVPVRTAADIAAEKAAAAAPRPVKAGPLTVSRNVVLGAVGAIGVGLLGFVGVIAIGGSKPAQNLTLSEQIQAYGVMAVPGQVGPRRDDAGPAALAGQARQAAEKALANNKNLEARISAALEAAGLDLRPAEWLLFRAGAGVVGALLGVLIGAGNIVLGALVFLIAVIAPTIYLKFKAGRRLKAFSSGLADTLQLMSGSLSAGLSLAQSIDTIVREGADPISSEFRRVVIETRLGVTLEDSMEGVAERMQSRDFAWVVMAIRIQREVGGNLAELLLTVAATLREREYLRRHVRGLSAEGRLSCYVLGGLPPGFMLYLAVSKPDYVKPMYTTPIGWILVAAMSVLLGAGIFWMSKLAKVDV
jgi:tight adherence protein B